MKSYEVFENYNKFVIVLNSILNTFFCSVGCDVVVSIDYDFVNFSKVLIIALVLWLGCLSYISNLDTQSETIKIDIKQNNHLYKRRYQEKKCCKKSRNLYV